MPHVTSPVLKIALIQSFPRHNTGHKSQFVPPPTLASAAAPAVREGARTAVAVKAVEEQSGKADREDLLLKTLQGKTAKTVKTAKPPAVADTNEHAAVKPQQATAAADERLGKELKAKHKKSQQQLAKDLDNYQTDANAQVPPPMVINDENPKGLHPIHAKDGVVGGNHTARADAGKSNALRGSEQLVWFLRDVLGSLSSSTLRSIWVDQSRVVFLFARERKPKSKVN